MADTILSIPISRSYFHYLPIPSYMRKIIPLCRISEGSFIFGKWANSYTNTLGCIVEIIQQKVTKLYDNSEYHYKRYRTMKKIRYHIAKSLLNLVDKFSYDNQGILIQYLLMFNNV